MSVLKSLRVLARYNVLTPIALIAMAVPGVAFAANIVVPPGPSGSVTPDLATGDTFTNNGTITADANEHGVTLADGSVISSFINNSGASITATTTVFAGVGPRSGSTTITDFVNYGSIATVTNVNLVDGVRYNTGANFTNAQGATIASTGNTVQIQHLTGTFENSGDISSSSTSANTTVAIGTGTTNAFINSGSIRQTGSGWAVGLDGSVVLFLNRAGATIASVDTDTVVIGGTVGTFSNLGTITSSGGNAVILDGAVTTFSNAGAITSAAGATSRSVQFNNTVSTFNNLAGGMISGDYGVQFNSTVGSFNNAGSITGLVGSAVQANGLVTSFTNSGAIKGGSNGDDALNFDGGVTNFTNDTGGLIQNTLAATTTNGKTVKVNVDTANGGAAVTSFVNRGTILGGTSNDPNHQGPVVAFDSNQADAAKVIAFSNFGTISGAGTGVQFNGTNANGGIGTFWNASGALISSTTQEALGGNGTIDTFKNAGTLKGAGDNAVGLYGGVGTFLNDTGGAIENVNANKVGGGFGGNAVTINVGALTGKAPTSFINRGTIRSASNSDPSNLADAVGFYGFNSETATVVDVFDNEGGTIASTNGNGVTLQGGANTFRNSGSITTANFVDRAGVVLSAGNATVTNSGLIQGAAAFVAFNNTGLTLTNTATGQLIGMKFEGVYSDATASINNAGYIKGGENAIKLDDGGAVVNSGTLQGGTVGAIAFNGGNDDKLTITTGSRIFGGVDFGSGIDTLDFAGFIGNTVLDVKSLQTLVPGTTPYFDTRDVNGDGKIAIVDIAGLNNQTIGQSLLDMLLGSNELISGQMLDASGADAVPTQFAPTLRTPALDAVDTAVLTEMDTVQKMGTKVWGGFVGGGSAKATPIDQSAVYGGIVFGAHAQLDPTFKLGGTAGYVMTTSTRQGGTQALATQTGLLGVYGQASLGVADIDVSLLAGGSAHTSTRQVIANNTTETATGIFNSMFLAPSIGVTIPVLDNEMGELLVKTSATYVGGTTTAYTETGSSMNLAVGAQTISVFDARIGLEGRKAIDIGDGVTADIVAKAGILVQGNGGSASVPVTAFGQTINVATPGTSALGVYGGVGLDTQLTDTLNLNMGVDGAFRTDGLNSLAVKGTLGGTF